MDEWKVDLRVAGSQKGLMLPAGLGIICVSPKALEAAAATAKQPRCYFDYARPCSSQNTNGYFPYTPALPLLYGLRESLTMPSRKKASRTSSSAHTYLAAGVRAAVRRAGVSRSAPRSREWYSDTVSAIVVPEGVDARQIIDAPIRRYNLSLGAGLCKVAGKVFRIGHVGDMNELMLLLGDRRRRAGDARQRREDRARLRRRPPRSSYLAREPRPSPAGPPGGMRGMASHRKVVFLDRAVARRLEGRARRRRPRVRRARQDLDRRRSSSACKGATVAITNKVPLRADALEQLPDLKMVAVAATGNDMSTWPPARSAASRSRTSATTRCDTVPEHVFALILALRRNLLRLLAGRRSRRVAEAATSSACFDHPIGDLAGATLGIVGYGALGQGRRSSARALRHEGVSPTTRSPKMTGVEFDCRSTSCWPSPT